MRVLRIIFPSLPPFPLPSSFIFSSGSSLLSCNSCRLLSVSCSHQKCNSKDWPGTQDLLCCHKLNSLYNRQACKRVRARTHTHTHTQTDSAGGVVLISLCLQPVVCVYMRVHVRVCVCEKYSVSRAWKQKWLHSFTVLADCLIYVCPAQESWYKRHFNLLLSVIYIFILDEWMALFAHSDEPTDNYHPHLNGTF